MTTPAAVPAAPAAVSPGPSGGGALLSAGLLAVLAHWRPLAVVLVPTLVPALLLAEAIRIGQAGPAATILDGVLRPDATVDGSVVGWLILAVAWLIGLNAAMLVLAGRLRGVAVPPRQALRRAARTAPESAVAMVLLLVLTALVLGCVTGAASGGEELKLPVLLVGIVLGLALVSTRLLVLPALVLRNNDEPLLRHVGRLASGRLPSTGIALSAVIVLPWLADRFDSASAALDTSHPRAIALLLRVLVVVGVLLVTAVQASLLTVAYLRPRGPRQPGPAETDLARIDRILAGHGATATPPPPRRAAGWALAALVPLPMLLGVAVAAVNPYGSPRADSYEVSWSGGIVAAAWPAGRHPIVVTEYAVHWCRDDACADSDTHTSEVTWFGSDGTSAAIGADGAVVAAGLRGRDVPDLVRTDGNDAVQLERCEGPGRCTDGITKWHTGGKEEQPLLAVAPGPDGSIVVATARPLPVKEGVPTRAELAVTRCNTVHCTRRSLAVLGTVDVMLSAIEGGGSGMRTAVPRMTLTLDDQDRPTVLLRDAAGTGAWLATCPAADCAGAHVDRIAAPGDPTVPAVLLDRGGPALVPGYELGGDQGEWPLTVRGHTVCGLTTAPGPGPDVYFHFGPAEQRRRLAAWCEPADGFDGRPRRITLAQVDAEPYYQALVAGPDGRLLVMWSDDGHRYAMLVTP
ncbi:hypothetical protein [Catellatospora sp. TT07R-123]|uniref:hypothetical protein n=1 Tax=Catellatospora sp. TT07R-123 TaxID=2733863 RepID=UPI001BB39982|nr:hypothetical protein [Catellatospora sp. TT07R-123]